MSLNIAEEPRVRKIAQYWSIIISTTALKLEIVLITIALAILVRTAEGLTLYEQRETDPTPPSYVLKGSRLQHITDLSGAWEVLSKDRKNWSAGWIPSCFSEAQTEVQYRKKFLLADSLRGWNFQLHVPEAHYSVEAWLNGRLVASHSGNHLGFMCDFARDHLQFGTSNELILKVSNRLSADRSLPVMPQLLQPLNYGGIFSGVYLRGVPAWSLENITMEELAPNDSTAKSVAIAVRIARYGAAPSTRDSAWVDESASVYVRIADSAGFAVASGRSDGIGSGSGNAFQVRITLPPVRPLMWSPDSPNLYLASAYLVVGTDTLHEISRLVGFKQVRIVGNEILVNGEQIQLRAMDYVPESANSRRSISTSQMTRDLLAMKELRMNAIRVLFSPPSETLVNLADSVGLFMLVESGLQFTPAPFLANPHYIQLAEKTFELISSRVGGHACVLGWGLGSDLNWNDQRTETFSKSMKGVIRARSSLPCFIETSDLGRRSAEADFVLYAINLDEIGGDIPQSVADFPVVYSRVGSLAGYGGTRDLQESGSVVRQAEILTRAMLGVQEQQATAGFVIHAFSDYRGSSPLLSQPATSDSRLYSFGLVGLNRQERLAYFKLRDLAQTGIVTLPSPQTVPSPSSSAYLIIGLGGLLILSLELRRNNVLRQNLKRVFLHAHGFYSDLRYRRFLHTGQPLLLWLLESITLALLAASALFAMRLNRTFDFYLSLFLPWPELKASLVHLVWDPWRAVAYFTLGFLAVLVMITALIRISSIPFRERVDSWQSANYVLWSFAPILFLLPLSVVFFRVLDDTHFRFWGIVIVAAVLSSCGFKLISAIRTGFGTTFPRVLLTGIVISAFAATVLLFLLSGPRKTVAYISLFSHILP